MEQLQAQNKTTEQKAWTQKIVKSMKFSVAEITSIQHWFGTITQFQKFKERMKSQYSFLSDAKFEVSTQKLIKSKPETLYTE